MKRKDKAKLPGAGRRRKRQSELPGQAGKCLNHLNYATRHPRHLSASSPCLVTHEKSKLFGGRAENFYKIRSFHATRSCGEGGVSGYHSTYMHPHCMSRSAWAHSDAVIWEKGLGEGQWTLRWEPLGSVEAGARAPAEARLPMGRLPRRTPTFISSLITY